jgi:hypothetical protein
MLKADSIGTARAERNFFPFPRPLSLARFRFCPTARPHRRRPPKTELQSQSIGISVDIL